MKGNHFDNSVLVRSAVTSVGLSAAEKDAEFQTPLKLSKARREYFAITDSVGLSTAEKDTQFQTPLNN